MTDGLTCAVTAVVFLLGLAGTMALIVAGFAVIEKQYGMGWAFAFLGTVSSLTTCIVYGVLGGGR